MSELREVMAHPNVRAFLRVIRAGETSQGDEAYRMLFGGGLIDDLSAHPNRKVTQGSLTSTAAGAYQFLYSTWGECQRALGLADFGPDAQDLAACYLILRRGALDDVVAGRLQAAIAKCAKEWASLPGSPYGQPTRTMAQARKTYEQYGGTYDDGAAATPAPTPKPAPKEATMPLGPIVAAVLPSIIEAIPKLGKLFGSGSAVAERNVKAAELAMTIVKDATGAANEQDAATKLQTSPAAVQAATAAIEARWYELAEAGGGGIDGARKADAATRASGDILRSPSFWVAMLLLPLVYLLVLSLIGMIGTATWSDDVRAGLAGSLISAIVGGVVGYYYGQTTSRNRTPSDGAKE